MNHDYKAARPAITGAQRTSHTHMEHCTRDTTQRGRKLYYNTCFLMRSETSSGLSETGFLCGLKSSSESSSFRPPAEKLRLCCDDAQDPRPVSASEKKGPALRSSTCCCSCCSCCGWLMLLRSAGAVARKRRVVTFCWTAVDRATRFTTCSRRWREVGIESAIDCC